EFLSDLIMKFLDTIRRLDMDTRKLLLAQLAQRMMNNTITRFYKNRADENSKYHEAALNRMSENMKQQIQHDVQQSLANSASNSQSVAAMSGNVNGGALSSALNRTGNTQLRGQFSKMLNEAQQMKPAVVSAIQRNQLEKAFTKLLDAGSSSGLLDDAQALRAMSDLTRQSRN
ncbi:MAG TPA: hypothetical protein V6D23_18700, partial [Candidatus Obscuribacterales bacterium]